MISTGMTRRVSLDSAFCSVFCVYDGLLRCTFSGGGVSRRVRAMT